MTTSVLNRKGTGRSKWQIAAIVVVLLAVLLAVGLAVNGALPRATTTGEPADTPLARWQAQDLDSYRYTLQVGCFCIVEMTRPVVIEVRDGVVAGVTYVADGSAADPALFEQYATVEALFAVVDEAAAQDPARLDVVYDETTGVPLSVAIDISEMMADEELYLEVSDFEAIE